MVTNGEMGSEDVMTYQIGWVERAVRLLVGAPMAVSYFYLRHFSVQGAWAMLSVGLVILVSGLAQRPERRRAVQPEEREPIHFPQQWGKTTHGLRRAS